MKKIFTIVIMIVIVNSSIAQPYATGKQFINFTDISRNNRSVPTEIYYPANIAGDNVPISAGMTKFPVVVFGHGFFIGTTAYKWLADSLVKNGYIVVFPTTEGGILPNHLNFSLDLVFLSSIVPALNDLPTSFLYQRIIKKAAVGGHSMGGGASFLAAAGSKPDIYALFNFAAAETNPSAYSAATQNVKPSLIFSGSRDCITLPSVQQTMYNNSILACRTYINITDALHCQFANNNFLCTTGQFTSGCNNTPINAFEVFSKTITLLLPFLDYYLKDNCNSGDIFFNAYNSLTGITKLRSCDPLPFCGVVPINLITFTGVLHDKKIKLQWQTALEQNFHRFEIERSSDGGSFFNIANELSVGNNSGGLYKFIDHNPFTGTNFYRLKMIDLDGTFVYSTIIRIEYSKKDFTNTLVYPNPGSDNLNIQLQSIKLQPVIIKVYDIGGKQVQLIKTKLTAGLNDLIIPLGKIATGIYLIELKNENGEILNTFKIYRN